jgi:hypothetical protein
MNLTHYTVTFELQGFDGNITTETTDYRVGNLLDLRLGLENYTEYQRLSKRCMSSRLVKICQVLDAEPKAEG